MEELALSEGGPRVRFKAVLKGTLDDFFQGHPNITTKYEELCGAMKKHLQFLEECGVTPVLPDGKVGGNAGAVLSSGDTHYLIVTKSGKQANLNMDIYRDFVIVTQFDNHSWSCEYYSNDPNILPTSDTPLHFTALSSTLSETNSLNISDQPKYLLHGHAFANETDAEKFGFPISTVETLCSTPEDSQALFDLMALYKFPQYKVYIRKGHGFVLLGDSANDAWETFCKQMKPYL